MSSEGRQFRVIRPDSRMEEGFIAAIRHLINEIWSFRSHIWIVFREQFRSTYQGSGLGAVWSYILPLVPISVYLLLARMRVFPNFDGVNGAVYLIFGVTLWLLYSGCIQSPIQIVQSRNNEVMKTAFPLSAAIASGFAQVIFDTLLRAALLLMVMIVMKVGPSLLGLLLPLILAPAILLFIGIGLFLGILNVIYKDVSRIVAIALQYGIFVSGVIFPLPDQGILSRLNMFNPFSVFIEASRGILFHGFIPNLSGYLAMAVFSIIVFMLSCRIFFIMEYRVRGIS